MLIVLLTLLRMVGLVKDTVAFRVVKNQVEQLGRMFRDTPPHRGPLRYTLSEQKLEYWLNSRRLKYNNEMVYICARIALLLVRS